MFRLLQYVCNIAIEWIDYTRIGFANVLFAFMLFDAVSSAFIFLSVYDLTSVLVPILFSHFLFSDYSLSICRLSICFVAP